MKNVIRDKTCSMTGLSRGNTNGTNTNGTFYYTEE